ncbi:hypothetical protein [Streptomyces flaveolus]|uniref:hypothetical protein n=1 Tax=Streptomyces flaveolus TaxID=67297 RepID=UPI0016708AAB|nr:hypothetical protein [Streptomyces flaveolus]GGQ83026.1 hypothetical protein GCM10010216_50900 [Streptomyces flaveolus]
MTGKRDDGVPGAPAGAFLEVACDESGSDGENLTGGNTDVFAHASVCLPAASAAEAVSAVRDRIRSPAEEYKANHLLREKHRPVLEWLLGPSGPIHGHAHVHLTEKAYFVVDRTVALLLGDPAGALPLFRAGRRVFGDESWREFLTSANRLLWVRGNGDGDGTDAEDRAAPVDAFFRAVGVLRGARPPSGPAATLERLAAARSRADAHRAHLTAGPAPIPVLEPLLPAVVATAAHWSAAGRPVRLVHDRQNTLTPERIAWIEERARLGGVRLDGLRLVHARLDARVQLADFLAGIARTIASDALGGRGDAVLAGLLRPYLDAASVWGDEGSWRRLAGGGAGSPEW